jgi:hypothetical protein
MSCCASSAAHRGELVGLGGGRWGPQKLGLKKGGRRGGLQQTLGSHVWCKDRARQAWRCNLLQLPDEASAACRCPLPCLVTVRRLIFAKGFWRRWCVQLWSKVMLAGRLQVSQRVGSRRPAVYKRDLCLPGSMFSSAGWRSSVWCSRLATVLLQWANMMQSPAIYTINSGAVPVRLTALVRAAVLQAHRCMRCLFRVFSPPIVCVHTDRGQLKRR